MAKKSTRPRGSSEAVTAGNSSALPSLSRDAASDRGSSKKSTSTGRSAVERSSEEMLAKLERIHQTLMRIESAFSVDPFLAVKSGEGAMTDNAKGLTLGELEGVTNVAQTGTPGATPAQAGDADAARQRAEAVREKAERLAQKIREPFSKLPVDLANLCMPFEPLNAVRAVETGLKDPNDPDSHALFVLVSKYSFDKLGPDGFAPLIPAKFEGADVIVRALPDFIPSGGVTPPPSRVRAGTRIRNMQDPNNPGSLGAVVHAMLPGAGKSLCVLSCNHVIGRLNQASTTDKIQGQVNGAFYPIGLFSRSLTLDPNLTMTNVADVALAKVVPQYVSPEFPAFGSTSILLNNGAPVDSVSGSDDPFPGMQVCKIGPRTGLTFGRVLNVNRTAPVHLPYPNGFKCNFMPTFTIRGLGSAFGDQGDSGSLIMQVGTYRPVGIYIADTPGSVPSPNDLSLGCFITHVWNALALTRICSKIQDM